MESHPNQQRPAPDQVRQPEHTQSQQKRDSTALSIMKQGHGAEIYGRTGRKSRMRRLSHRLRDERRLADRERRQEVLEEAQEDTIDQGQGFGDR
jgi:hypothetical protein